MGEVILKDIKVRRVESLIFMRGVYPWANSDIYIAKPVEVYKNG